MIRIQCTIFVILPTWVVFLLFLSPFLRGSLAILTLSRRTVKKTSWSNPRQTRICYIFRVWVIIKALLKQISLYLLSHSRIRIIVLTCPDNINVILQVYKKSSAEIMRAVPAKSHKSPCQWCEANIISILPFSLFLFVWWLESTITKS